MHTPPQSEIKLLDFQVPEIEEILPTNTPSFLILETRMRNLISLSGSFVPKPSYNESREDFVARSPFSHDLRTGAVLVKLPRISRSRELYDGAFLERGDSGQQIGFVSLDNDDSPPSSEQLYLAHISTLRNEVLGVLNEDRSDVLWKSPIEEEEMIECNDEAFFAKEVTEEETEKVSSHEPVQEAFRNIVLEEESDYQDYLEDSKGSDESDGSGAPEKSIYGSEATVRIVTIPMPPILAYALVLKRTGIASDEYIRVGVAEMNYDWMIAGTKETITLV